MKLPARTCGRYVTAAPLLCTLDVAGSGPASWNIPPPCRGLEALVVGNMRRRDASSSSQSIRRWTKIVQVNYVNEPLMRN